MSHCSAHVSLFVALSLVSVFARAQQDRPVPPSSQIDTSDPVGLSFNSGRVTGTVRTTDGHPVSGASIELRDVGRDSELFSARSESNGSFALYNIPTGTYELDITSGSNDASERIDVGPASSNESLNIRLPDASSPSASKAGSDSTVSLSQYVIPAKARSLYKKAAQSMNRGKLDDSLNQVNAALSICPKFAEALTLRGMLQQDTGHQAQAVTDLQQAIQDDPNYPFSYLALARLFNSIGRYQESLPILAKAEQLAPDAWQTYFELSRAEVEKGDFSSALHDVDHASQLQGGPAKELPELHLIRGYALIGANEIPAAVRELQTFLARQPQGRIADHAREVLNQLHATSATAER